MMMEVMKVMNVEKNRHQENQKFHIVVGARKTIGSITRNCVTCRRHSMLLCNYSNSIRVSDVGAAIVQPVSETRKTTMAIYMWSMRDCFGR